MDIIIFIIIGIAIIYFILSKDMINHINEQSKYPNLPFNGPLKIVNYMTIRKTVRTKDKDIVIFMEALIHHFMDHPDPMVVPVYNFKVICKPYDYLYSYDMKQLQCLTNKEKKLIDTIGDLYEEYGYEACDQYKDLENPKLMNFLHTLIKSGKYWDIHSGNILKDEYGNYKLIDLEGFLNCPLNHKSNNWISRNHYE